MRFCHDFSGFSHATVPNMATHGTVHKARNVDFMGTTAISGAAAKPVSTQEALNWRAFSVGGQPMPPQRWPAKGGNAQWWTAIPPARFF
jgi:hypothetical protein